MDRQPGAARMRRWAAPVAVAGLAAALALGLAGCGPAVDPAASGPATSTSDPAGSSPPSAAATPAPSTPASTPAPAGPPAPAPSATMVPAPAPSGPPAAAPVTAPSLPTTAASLGEEVAFDTGITVEVVAMRVIQVTAETPGEVDGPALVVEVEARNGSASAQSVDSAVVTVETDDGELGIGTTAGSPSPLTGVVEPGQTSTGTYVFMLDPASGRDVTVSINYAAGEPIAVFTGTTP